MPRSRSSIGLSLPRPQLLPLLLLLSAASARADLVTYQVVAKTADEAWSRSLFPHEIRLIGEKGTSAWLPLANTATDGAVDSITHVVPDVGVVRAIHLRNREEYVLDASPAWKVAWVEVHRENEPGSVRVDATKSRFAIGEWLELNQVKTYSSPHVTGQPTVRVVATGREVPDTDVVTLVKMKENFSSVDQSVNQISEFWSREHVVGWVEAAEHGSETSFGTEISADTPFGGVGASASQAWSSVRSSERNESVSQVQGSEVQWGFTAAPYAYSIRLMEIEVPRVYKEYQEAGHPERRAWLRRVGDEIAGLSRELFVEVPLPEKLAAGDAYPASWSLIEREFVPYMTPEDRARVLGLRDEWLRQGVVHAGPRPPKPVPGTATGGPEPKPGPGPKPVPKPGVTPELLRGDYQVRCVGNGRNLHLDGLGDQLVSTRWPENDVWTVFSIRPRKDGSHVIVSETRRRALHANRNGDSLVSTRWDSKGVETRFRFEPAKDGTYRIRAEGGGYLRIDPEDQLLSTGPGGADLFARFQLIPR